MKNNILGLQAFTKVMLIKGPLNLQLQIQLLVKAELPAFKTATLVMYAVTANSQIGI